MDANEVERVANWLEGKFTVGEIHAAARGDLGDIREHAAKLLRSLAANDRRYRWLVANKLRHNGSAWHWQPGEPLWDENLDAAIDTAMARKEGER